MAGEEWARCIVAKELKRAVELNDDGSAPSMYDLRIGPFDAPEVAIECVGAINSAFTETWNNGPAREPLQLSVKGNWSVTIAVNAHVKTVKRYIEAILKELESRGLQEVHVNYLLRRSDMVLFDQL